MNWADLVIFLAVTLFALSAFYKGALRQVLDIASLVTSIVLSVTLYNYLAPQIATSFAIAGSISKIIAFFAIWIISQFLFNISLLFLYPLIPERIRKSKLNRVTGAIPGLVWGVFFISLIVIIISALPIRSPHKNTLADSYCARFINEQTSGVEFYISNILDDILEQALTFRTVKPNSSETTDLGFTVSAENLSVDEASERRMLELVNEERAKAGL